MTNRPGQALRRLNNVTLVNIKTPRSLGLYSSRPRVLQQQSHHYHEDPCTLCDSRCCAAKICVNVVDVLRLSLCLGVLPEHLAEASPTHKSDLTLAVMVQGQALHFLLHHRHVDELGRSACHMLARPGGALRCGVHSIRPGICRAYPFEFTTDRGGDEVFNVGLPHLCPRQWALNPTAQANAAAAILQWRRENDVAERIVRAWNRKKCDEDVRGFYKFAVDPVARFLKLNPRPLLLAMQPPRRLGARLW